jgi:hypothetical protein
MRATSVGFQCRSLQFSQDGSHLAVGGKLGRGLHSPTSQLNLTRV